MKKLLIIALALLSVSIVRADEGMWLLSKLKPLNIEKMQQMGFKLTAEDIYDEDYEVGRSELVELRHHIVEQDEEYQENEKAFLEQLKNAGIGREKFITVLDRLINDSDQRNSEVHISWF